MLGDKCIENARRHTSRTDSNASASTLHICGIKSLATDRPLGMSDEEVEGVADDDDADRGDDWRYASKASKNISLPGATRP